MNNYRHLPFKKKQSPELETELLLSPALPLLSIVQFIFLTGPFTTVAEVIKEIPSPIETGYTTYEQPEEILLKHHRYLETLELIKEENEPDFIVVDQDGTQLDQMTTIAAMVQQQVLASELEEINSRLCSPCGCTLCCIGPSEDMEQLFFEIPLKENEVELFPVPTYNKTGRQHLAMDESPLIIDDKPFYERRTPALFQWQNGWSLIMPTGTSCPNLEKISGRCRVYPDRPEVCRRPQIFPYILEPLNNHSEDKPVYRHRQTLLAIMDCPYVSALKEEISAYGAACELEVIFKQNKA